MIEGKAVAVTGASSGCGEAIALAFAARGATLALAGRRPEPLAALARAIEEDGGRALALPTDIGDERQARAFVEHAYEHLGRLDVLVNAAGLVLAGPVEGGDTERWRALVRVNVLGVLYCTHAALPVMRAQGAGHIVNVRAHADGPVDELARSTVAGFSAALREEVARIGVAVTVVDANEDAAEEIVRAVELAALSTEAG